MELASATGLALSIVLAVAPAGAPGRGGTAAQDPPPALPNPAARTPTAPPALGPVRPPEQGDRVRIDAVIATVNDSAILESELRTATAGEIRARQLREGRQLAPAERTRVLAIELQKLIHKHQLAQSAKTLGVLPPDRIEAIFRDMLREEEAEQVRDLGSEQRFSQALEQRGRTWQTFYREQRIDKLYDIARQLTIGGRLQNQSNLFVTPRMLRDFYREHRDLFVHGAVAIVAEVAFVGTQQQEHARAAAAIWAKESIGAETLARQFADRGALRVTEQLRVDDRSRESLNRADLIDFALRGPKGAVSEPMLAGTAVRLVKILDYLPARDGRFEDPEVQLEIRERLEREVILDLEAQALQRASDRTYVWVSSLVR
jgi:hypothetical protein